MIISFVLVAFLIGLDQLTKYLATAFLAPVGVCPFIPGVMELRYVRNEGAAFSLLADAAWGRAFLIVVTALALAALAVGNLIDRIAHGSVVDFFATTFIDFAVFNVADCFVCVGAGLLALLMLRQELGAAKTSGGDTPQKTV